MDLKLQAVYDEYRAKLAGQSAEWCQLRPGGDGNAWNAQELVEHLVLALRSSKHALETRIEKGRPSRGSATLIQRLRRTAVFTFRRLPRGIPAPPFVRPGLMRWGQMDGTALAEQFRHEVDSVDKILSAIRERFGNRRVAAHFLLGPLSEEEWRRFHVIHCRHHLDQLRRIEEAVSPAAPHGRGRPGTRTTASVL